MCGRGVLSSTAMSLPLWGPFTAGGGSHSWLCETPPASLAGHRRMVTLGGVSLGPHSPFPGLTHPVPVPPSFTFPQLASPERWHLCGCPLSVTATSH